MTPLPDDLQALRLLAHAVFDQLWKSKLMSRGEAYRRLMHLLALPMEEAHFARLNRDQLQEVIRFLDGMKVRERRGENRTKRRLERHDRNRRHEARAREELAAWERTAEGCDV